MTWKQLKEHEDRKGPITALLRVQMTDGRHDRSYAARAILQIDVAGILWIDFLREVQRVERDLRNGAIVTLYVTYDGDFVAGTLTVDEVSERSELVRVSERPAESARELLSLSDEVSRWKILT